MNTVQRKSIAVVALLTSILVFIALCLSLGYLGIELFVAREYPQSVLTFVGSISLFIIANKTRVAILEVTNENHE